ncbi:hypothetical protein IFR05_013648 [Cadophora sp. M221]|nr:hypothetical protein IFR05_013648 [Cadophora sp. M221]
MMEDAAALMNSAVTKLENLEGRNRWMFEYIFGSNDPATIRSDFQSTMGVINIGREMRISCEDPTIPDPTCLGRSLSAYMPVPDPKSKGIMFCQAYIKTSQVALGSLPLDLLTVTPSSNTGQGPRAAHLEDIYRLSGPLLLHEIMHWASPLYRKSNDLSVAGPACGWVGVFELGRDNPGSARNDADSYEMLAIALYFDKYDWSTGFARDPNAMDIDKRKLLRVRRLPSIAM